MFTIFSALINKFTNSVVAEVDDHRSCAIAPFSNQSCESQLLRYALRLADFVILAVLLEQLSLKLETVDQSNSLAASRHFNLEGVVTMAGWQLNISNKQTSP